MLNSDMTKTSSECLDNMSADDVQEWLKQFLFRALDAAKQNDWILDYRYDLIKLDLLEAKDELTHCIEEMKIGLFEKKCSMIKERMMKGLELIRQEENERKKEKMWLHYTKLQNELNEVGNRCLNTRY